MFTYVHPKLAHLEDTYGDELEVDAQATPKDDETGPVLYLETHGCQCLELDRPRVEALRDLLTRWLETGRLEPGADAGD